MTDKKLYTPAEHALNVLEAKASAARRRAHGTNLRAYQDAVMEVGYAYLKAHPTKAEQAQQTEATLTITAPNGDTIKCHGTKLDMATLELIVKAKAAA